jgi:hypothetical protein
MTFNGSLRSSAAISKYQALCASTELSHLIMHDIAGIVVSIPRQESDVQTLNSSARGTEDRQSEKSFMTTMHPVGCVCDGVY